MAAAHRPSPPRSAPRPTSGDPAEPARLRWRGRGHLGAQRSRALVGGPLQPLRGAAGPARVPPRGACRPRSAREPGGGPLHMLRGTAEACAPRPCRAPGVGKVPAVLGPGRLLAAGPAWLRVGALRVASPVPAWPSASRRGTPGSPGGLVPAEAPGRAVGAARRKAPSNGAAGRLAGRVLGLPRSCVRPLTPGSGDPLLGTPPLRLPVPSRPAQGRAPRSRRPSHVRLSARCRGARRREELALQVRTGASGLKGGGLAPSVGKDPLRSVPEGEDGSPALGEIRTGRKPDPQTLPQGNSSTASLQTRLHEPASSSCGRAARPCHSTALATEPASSKLLPFEAIPRSGHNAWLNLYQFWRSNSFQNFHHVMQKNFQNLGPIYRETIGTYDCVNVLLPSDAAQLFQSEGTFPRRKLIDSWTAHRKLRNHKCGVFLNNGEEWRSDRLVLNKEVISPVGTRKFLPFLNTVAEDFVDFMHRQVRKNTRRSLTVDLYHDLFRFTLEASSYALYGERLGLLEESPQPESLQFIHALETMLRTTLPLLFLPPGVMRWVNNKLWQDHMDAWDAIFKHADRCIQNIYQEFCLGQPRKYSGIMAELLLQAELPLDAIKANIIEFTAGGVDTTAMPLLFTLFELARNPHIQTALREEIKAAESTGPGECSTVLNRLPLLKGTIKETLRLYPVGITVQRYPTQDVVLQNYCVPAGTLCQVGLYAMGRSPDVFSDPERYDPRRWLSRENNFKALAFGFGARQCIGRRLAEAEMMLFLMHVLRNFKIDTVSKADIKTVFGFILMPEKPPLLTFRPID